MPQQRNRCMRKNLTFFNDDFVVIQRNKIKAHKFLRLFSDHFEPETSEVWQTSEVFEQNIKLQYLSLFTT